MEMQEDQKVVIDLLKKAEEKRMKRRQLKIVASDKINNNFSTVLSRLVEDGKVSVRKDNTVMYRWWDNYHIRKKPKVKPVERIETIWEIGQKYDEKRGWEGQYNPRFLFYWLYLTGQRINEALDIKRDNISIRKRKGRKYFIVKSKTLKTKKHKERNIVIPLFSREENMVLYIWDKIKDMVGSRYLFPHFNRQKAYNYLSEVEIEKKAFNESTGREVTVNHKINPHYLRHCRATHLASYYGYELYDLMQFFGWDSTSMPKNYARLNPIAMIDKIIENEDSDIDLEE